MFSFRYVFLMFLCIYGCHGNYYFDLFEVFTMFNPVKSGTTIVDGPKTRQYPNGGEKGIDFTDKAIAIETTGTNFAYLGHSFYSSKDITFSTYFKYSKRSTTGNYRWTFFSLMQDSTEHSYFAVGFAFDYRDQICTEGICVGGGANAKPKIFIDQYRHIDRTTHTSSASFEFSKLKKDKWMLLMVRLEQTKPAGNGSLGETTVSVTLDCKELVPSFKLKYGNIESFILKGYGALGMALKKDFTGRNIKPMDNFVGSLFQPEVINGKYAFEFYSQCDAAFSVQTIPSEPLPSEYSDARMKLFQKVTSENLEPVHITCVDPLNNKTYYNGEDWKHPKDKCIKRICKDGKITDSYTCKQCVQKGKKYKRYEKWIDPANICQENRCMPGDYWTETDISTACIKNLQCGTYGKAPKTECCEKCLVDSCKTGRQYYNGCDRKCGQDINFTCKKEKLGCWCTKGKALDEKGDCIDTDQCPCKSGSRVYKAGDTVKRSSCEKCTCTHGVMVCSRQCFN